MKNIEILFLKMHQKFFTSKIVNLFIRREWERFEGGEERFLIKKNSE